MNRAATIRERDGSLRRTNVKNIATNLRATVHWIRVEDEMPDSDIVVLIASPDDDEPVWMGFHDGECWRNVDAGQAHGVTHWANLPEPPTS